MQKSMYFQTSRGINRTVWEGESHQKGERKQKVGQTAQKMVKMHLNMVITVNVNRLNLLLKRKTILNKNSNLAMLSVRKILQIKLESKV